MYKRLSAQELYKYFSANTAKYVPSREKKFRHSDGKELSYYFNVKDRNYIVSTPAHDSTSNNLATIAQPIENVLENVKDELKENTSILVPICQMRKILWIFPRNHFTFLEIHKDSNGKIIAHHHDSKGKLAKFYSLAKIKSAIQKVFGKDVQIQCSYYGHQSDNVNCGRFVVGYIEQRINEQNISNTNNKFTDIDSQIFKGIIKPDKVDEVKLLSKLEIKENHFSGKMKEKRENTTPNKTISS